MRDSPGDGDLARGQEPAVIRQEGPRPPNGQPASQDDTLTPAGPARARPRAPGLDGLRGLAVLAVLAFHERISVLPGGFLGVDVFFVISGYLITDLLVAPFDRDGRLDLRRFWLRRARRLLPALAVVLITVTAAVAVLEPGEMPAMRPALLGALTYTSNWWQAVGHQSYFAAFGPPPALQHLWSLAVEEQFYLVWPLAVILIASLCRSRRARATVAWLAAAASAAGMAAGYLTGLDPSRLYYGTDTHATALLTGAALALTWPLSQAATASPRTVKRRNLAGLAGGAVLIWEMGRLSGADGALYLGGLALAAVAAGSVVLAATGPGIVSDVLSGGPVRWLGVRSYGIYLWHWPVIALFAARAAQQSSTFGVRAAETALPIALAAVSWRWIEAPILRDGLRATLRGYTASIARSAVAARQTPLRALSTLVPAIALALTCAAGYGVFYSPSGPTLQQQIAAGARVSASHTQPLAGPEPAPGLGRISRVVPGAGPRTPPGTPDARIRPGALGPQVTAIGDSVMLAAAVQLRAALPGVYINADISRQMDVGLAVVRGLAAAGKLRPIMVVGLGTNGAVTAGQMSSLLTLAGRHRAVVLVNTYVPRSWQDEVNGIDAATARRHHNVVLASWFQAISGRTGLLWDDGVHPQPAGAALYARVVRAAVRLAAARLAPPARARPAMPVRQVMIWPARRLGLTPL